MLKPIIRARRRPSPPAAELAAAAQILGLQAAILLDYRDGELAQAEPAGVVSQL